MSKLALTEIEKKVLSQKPDSKSFDLAAYIGGKFRKDLLDAEKSRLTYVGLTVPATRRIFKEGFEFLKSAPSIAKEHFKIWNYIFHNSEIYEVKSIALMHLRQLTEEFLLSELKAVKKLVDQVDNWAHSDELSHLYARMLEHSPKQVWPILKEWNQSKNPWHRRQSIVGMLNYAKQRKKFPPTVQMLKMIENLIDDEAFYVQRGVGWSLREVYHVDPKAQVAFVKKNLNRLSSIAWSAASEKYPLALKKQLVKERKAGRKN